MTSAPNRLLPLSGNKLKFIISLILLFFSVSLSAQDKPDEDEDVKVEAAVIVNPYKYLDSLTYSRKPLYNVMFILPIGVNRINLGDGKEIPTSMPQETREALGFWEGVNIAFGKIKRMNAKFNFHIWDNQKNDSATMDILQELETKKIDAVVAPFHTKQALMVSEYCKKRKIPTFLAQNPSDVPAKDNPYAFKFHNPKQRLFYDYYLKIVTNSSERNTDVFFVYDGLNKSERKVANYIKYMSEKDGSKRLKLLDYNSDLVLKNYYDTTRNAIFMISYYNTAKVNEIIGKLSDLNSDRIKIFGHNLWSTNTKMDMALLEKFQAKVYTDFYYGNNRALLNDVKGAYNNMTKDNITSDVFLGYDVASYIAEVLDRFGVKFPLSCENYKYNGVVTNVNMRPNFDNKNSRLLFFENSTKLLLRATKDGWVVEE
jgi:hypothetical protein